MRLHDAGYPSQVLASVAEGMLRQAKKTGTAEHLQAHGNTERKRTAAIPYIHKFSHNLKKISRRGNIDVAFSARNKLISLRGKTRPEKKGSVPSCQVNHRKKLVDGKTSIIYRTPLSSGNYYAGQTGRCINDRLRERKNKADKDATDGFFSHHRKQHQCFPLHLSTTITGRSKCEMTRLIIDAQQIDALGESCISKPSLAPTDKELQVLRMF